MKKAKPTAIDLFCGCGGISCGLQQAGFNVLAGVDIEKKYMVTFAQNFTMAKSLCLDISSTSPRNFLKIIGMKAGELDLLAGGPPCQGFSKNVPRKFRFLNDQNNKLIKTFLDYCEVLQPRLILMENVAEMKNGFNQAYTEEIVARLREEGYTVTQAILNAADYGVPQRRRRAFFMANRDAIELLPPSPTHDKNSSQLDLLSKSSHVSVWEAIGDLPSLKHGNGDQNCKYKLPPQSEYQMLMRNGQNTVSNHVARKLQATQYERIASLKPGQSHKNLPMRLQVKSGYSGAYGRLTKEMIAPTITRWVFHPGSGRWGHPVDLRLITIREVARIQGFPDSFEFIGSYLQQAGQLGNAVPPLLIKQIAQSMLHQVYKSDLDKRSMNFSKENFSFSVGSEKLMV